MWLTVAMLLMLMLLLLLVVVAVQPLTAACRQRCGAASVDAAAVA
jgi:hypothetical protein